MEERSGGRAALRCVACFSLRSAFLLSTFLLSTFQTLLSAFCCVSRCVGRYSGGWQRRGAVQCGAVRCGVIKFARVLALFSVRRRDAYIRARERVLRVSVLDGD